MADFVSTREITIELSRSLEIFRDLSRLVASVKNLKAQVTLGRTFTAGSEGYRTVRELLSLFCDASLMPPGPVRNLRFGMFSGSLGSMKIALMHDSILPPKTYGGIERIVCSLAYEYKRLGHDIVVVCRKGSNLKDFEMFEIPVGYQQCAASTWLPKDIDFLHAHQPLPIKPEIPYLVTIHGNGHPHEKYWRNTNFLSQSHCRNHNGKHFIYNGVDPEHYPFVEKKEDYFVFLARASWRVKNLKTCVELANDLQIRLEVMGGTGTSTKYVRYHGTIGEADGKLDILSRARALIYPTNWDEPCAVAPLEALACGTPVISSVNGCMSELVRPGTGVLCHSYEDLLRAPTALDSINAAQCRKSVENYFSVSRMARDYLNLIQKIMREGELNQHPHYNFRPDSVQYIFKPSSINRFRFMVTGRV